MHPVLVARNLFFAIRTISSRWSWPLRGCTVPAMPGSSKPPPGAPLAPSALARALYDELAEADEIVDPVDWEALPEARRARWERVAETFRSLARRG